MHTPRLRGYEIGFREQSVSRFCGLDDTEDALEILTHVTWQDPRAPIFIPHKADLVTLGGRHPAE